MAKPLSLKSRVIRKGLQVHPNLSNSELADVLNKSEDCKQNDIQVTPNDVANQKQALKQLAHPPAQEPAPAEPNGHVEAPAARTPPAAAPASVSKAEAVRTALREGHELPEDGVAFIKQRFDIDMERTTFSSYKTAEKKKLESAQPKGKPGRKPAQTTVRPTTEKAAPDTAVVVAEVLVAAPTGDIIDDIAAIKGLVAKMGADQVKRVVDLFG